MSQEGGNIFVNVAELSVPFGLLFALKAYKDKKVRQKKTKPSQKGGECMICNKHGGRNKIKEDIETITSSLSKLLKNSQMEI